MKYDVTIDVTIEADDLTGVDAIMNQVRQAILAVPGVVQYDYVDVELEGDEDDA